MSIAQTRCKKCGRPLSQDEQLNFFSFCYDCFRDYRSSKMRKGSAMRIIGVIGVIFVSLFIFTYSFSFEIMHGFERPLRGIAFIIGSIIAELIPVVLIVLGTRLKSKWSTMFKAKPIELQRVITIPAPNTVSSQTKFCPECGNKISDQTQKFCANCGANIQNL